LGDRVRQVKLDEAKDANGNNDFEKYGLLILVKFRENSELKPIGTFPSGGEISLSTMLFMLSLQQLTDALEDGTLIIGVANSAFPTRSAPDD